MIHLYCGNGKGKTTAAMGLALRMAGRGKKVLIAQFLKSENSGERKILSTIPGIHLLPLPKEVKFLWNMTEQERAEEQHRSFMLLLHATESILQNPCDLLVLDELCGAVSEHLVSIEDVMELLDLCEQHNIEVVMTGQNPHTALLERASYITEMKNLRHPFDLGQPARIGVEF